MDANGDGTLDQSGPGWNGYESQDLANLVTRSHAAGDRVVLTVTCFSQSALDQITSDPTAAAQLSSSLIAAVSAKNLDGVNFDFEGQGSADRKGLTSLITQVSTPCTPPTLTGRSPWPPMPARRPTPRASTTWPP